MGRSVSRRQLRLAPGNASGFGQAKSREPGEPPRVEVTANGASFWFPPDVGCDPRADGGRCAGHGVATVEIAVHVDERQGPAGRLLRRSRPVRTAFLRLNDMAERLERAAVTPSRTTRPTIWLSWGVRPTSASTLRLRADSPVARSSAAARWAKAVAPIAVNVS